VVSAYLSEKWWSSSVGNILPNIRKNKKCSKPPTSHCCWFITWYIWHFFLPSGNQPWLENPPFKDEFSHSNIYLQQWFPQDCHIYFPQLSHEHLHSSVIFRWFSHGFPMIFDPCPGPQGFRWHVGEVDLDLGPATKHGDFSLQKMVDLKRWNLGIFDDFFCLKKSR